MLYTETKNIRYTLGNVFIVYVSLSDMWRRSRTKLIYVFGVIGQHSIVRSIGPYYLIFNQCKYFLF